MSSILFHFLFRREQHTIVSMSFIWVCELDFSLLFLEFIAFHNCLDAEIFKCNGCECISAQKRAIYYLCGQQSLLMTRTIFFYECFFVYVCVVHLWLWPCLSPVCLKIVFFLSPFVRLFAHFICWKKYAFVYLFGAVSIWAENLSLKKGPISGIINKFVCVFKHTHFI